MGFNNGYDSGYADAIEDVRNGKVAGLGSASGGGGAASGGGEAQKRYTVVVVEGGFPGTTSLGTLPDDDVLRVTMADLGVDSASSDSQTMDFGLIEDRLAPVVAFDIFWNISTGDVSVVGPKGYNWNYLESNISPGRGLAVALAASGDTFSLS